MILPCLEWGFLKVKGFRKRNYTFYTLGEVVNKFYFVLSDALRFVNRGEGGLFFDIGALKIFNYHCTGKLRESNHEKRGYEALDHKWDYSIQARIRPSTKSLSHLRASGQTFTCTPQRNMFRHMWYLSRLVSKVQRTFIFIELSR